jgi:hypothetical protein
VNFRSVRCGEWLLLPLMSQELSGCMPHLPDGLGNKYSNAVQTTAIAGKASHPPPMLVVILCRNRMTTVQVENRHRTTGPNRPAMGRPQAERARSGFCKWRTCSYTWMMVKAQLISAQGYTGVERQAIRSSCEIGSASWSRRRVHPCSQRRKRVATALEAWKLCCSFASSKE